MLLPKGSYFDGDNQLKINKEDAIYLSLGLIGALIVLYGFMQTHTQPTLDYVIGAFFLLTTAIYFKLTYFIALQLILIAGHGAILLGIGSVSQLILPILLCLQLFIYYSLSGQLNNPYLFIGIVGIALLSIAFAYENSWVVISGSLAISIYAFNQVYKKRLVALLWALLNLAFVLGSTYKLIF